MSERLQKFLARAGVASRRHAEGLITAGRVSVNNQRVTELGSKVEPTDLVTVDGALVTAPETTSWYLLHKPPGVVTTLSDPQGRPTVAGLLAGVAERVFPVGRLDWDAEGALLLTNDGAAAHRLLHPSFEVPRTYLVKVKGSPTDETLARLLEGVRLEDGPARALRAERHEAAERNTWLLLQVGEGRPHLVKRLCAAVGHPVLRLFRPAQAGISVAGLQPGELRALTAEELARVQSVAAGASVPEPAPFLPPRRHGRAGQPEAEETGPGFEKERGGEDVGGAGRGGRPGPRARLDRDAGGSGRSDRPRRFDGGGPGSGSARPFRGGAPGSGPRGAAGGRPKHPGGRGAWEPERQRDGGSGAPRRSARSAAELPDDSVDHRGRGGERPERPGGRGARGTARQRGGGSGAPRRPAWPAAEPGRHPAAGERGRPGGRPDGRRAGRGGWRDARHGDEGPRRFPKPGGFARQDLRHAAGRGDQAGRPPRPGAPAGGGGDRPRFVSGRGRGPSDRRHGAARPGGHAGGGFGRGGSATRPGGRGRFGALPGGRGGPRRPRPGGPPRGGGGGGRGGGRR